MCIIHLEKPLIKIAFLEKFMKKEKKRKSQALVPLPQLLELASFLDKIIQ